MSDADQAIGALQAQLAEANERIDHLVGQVKELSNPENVGETRLAQIEKVLSIIGAVATELHPTAAKSDIHALKVDLVEALKPLRVRLAMPAPGAVPPKPQVTEAGRAA